VNDAGPTDDMRSKPDKRQSTGDSRDTAQQHRMTLGTASCIFDSLGYSKEDYTNDTISFGIKDRRNDGKRPEAQDNGAPGAGTTYGRTDEGVTIRASSILDPSTRYP